MKSLNRCLSFLVVLCLALFLAPERAEAQGCAVSVSIATSATSSSTCFVKAGETAYANLTGTWVGTVDVQYSYDNGASYQTEFTTTAVQAYTLAPKPQNALWKVLFRTRTSGTLTGSVIYNSPVLTALAYADIPIGLVGYSSFGASTTLVTTSGHVGQIGIGLEMQRPFLSTGVAVLNGATVGTNKVRVDLYNAAGGLVLSTATAGATTSGANAFQSYAWSAGPVYLQPGYYFAVVQINGTTDTLRMVAVSTAVNLRAGAITGQVFGTVPAAISPPTTFTANEAAILYIY